METWNRLTDVRMDGSGRDRMKEDEEIIQRTYIYSQWTQTTVVKVWGTERKTGYIYNSADIKKHTQYFHVGFFF